MGSLFIVITTVQPPTLAVRDLAIRTAGHARKLVIVGDGKGPREYELGPSAQGVRTHKPINVQLLTLRDQIDGPYELARKLPVGHYSRKNIGYLQAISEGATCIYETDDDNSPLSCWQPRPQFLSAGRFVPSPGKTEAGGAKRDGDAGRLGPRPRTGKARRQGTRWVNVYKYFTSALIWPRGLPLDEIHSAAPHALPLELHGSAATVRRLHERGRQRFRAALRGESVAGERGGAGSMASVGGGEPESRGLRAPIQQGLVNTSPDVDAIWRLVLGQSLEFANQPSVYLSPGNWCPFNSQSTWWWPEAYPLLYIPSHCSFRMCDIWRSFVAQRCLWAQKAGIAFHAPEVDQVRNAHDLMRDFSDETPGFHRNRELTDLLSKLNLESGYQAMTKNLRRCYAALVRSHILPAEELQLVDAWLDALRTTGRARRDRRSPGGEVTGGEGVLVID